VVMTTGAMANFAKIGDKVNIAAFSINDTPTKPILILTNGHQFIHHLPILKIKTQRKRIEKSS